MLISITGRLKTCSHSFVWVEHNSDGGSHGLWWKIFKELGSNCSSVSVSVDNLAPSDSVSSIVDSVFGLVDVSNSFTEVPSGSSLVLAVLDGEQSLVRSLSGLSSSESGEDSFLIKSHRLGLVVHLLLGRLDFLWHSSFF